MHRETTSVLERFIGATTYLTGGVTGICFYILSFIMKFNVNPFVQFHVTQSVVLYLGIYIINLFLSIIFGFLLNISFLKNITRTILNIFELPIYFGFSLIGACVSIVILYLAIGALLGKYSYFPIISNVILRRK